jgi:D-xylonolactonase
MLTISTVLNTRLCLGEGLIWDAHSAAFWFVDIYGRMVYQYRPGAEIISSWSVPEEIGWLIPASESNIWIGGLRSGVARLEFGKDLIIDWIAQPFKEIQSMRLNDAKADSLGNIWAGSMNQDDESRPDGNLFRLSPSGMLTIHDSGYCVANGPAISPCEQLLLHSDSARRTIYAFDFNKHNASITNKRVWRVFSQSEGLPDGMNFDAQGNLWVAHWGSGLVSCFSLDGDLLDRVSFPVSRVTNISFGGENLTRLLVTTASYGLSTKQLALEPLAGAIFEIHGHGKKGFLANSFGGH